MVAHKTVLTRAVSWVIMFFKVVVEVECSFKCEIIFQKRLNFLHTCVSFADLPSYISTMRQLLYCYKICSRDPEHPVRGDPTVQIPFQNSQRRVIPQGSVYQVQILFLRAMLLYELVCPPVTNSFT